MPMKLLNIDGLKANGTTIIVTDRVYVSNDNSAELIGKLREFDLANATPLMCYDFLRSLKSDL